MGVIKKSKLFLGIFIPILAFFLMSQNTSAVSLSGLNFLKISYSFNGGSFQELIRHNTYLNLPDTLLSVPANATSDRINYFVVSGNLPSSSTGSYFNGSINFEILANADNSFNAANCNGVSGYIFPEQGTVSDSQSRSECNVSNNGRILNVSIITSGKLISEGTPTSWYSEVENNDNFLFSCSSSPGSMSAPCRQQEVKINSATLNFNVTRDETVAGLDNIVNQNQTIINQNETIINNQNENTDAIINNQNENTDAIIKSNQNCYSPNLMSLGSALGMNDIRRTYFQLDLEPGTYTLSFKLDDFNLGSTSNFNIYFAIYFANSSSDFNVLNINSSTIKNNRYSYTFTINQPTNSNSNNNNIRITATNFDNGARASLSEIQIEKGTTASEYVPYGEEVCKNINQEYYDEQRQADQNISNQSPSDIDGAENQATTNLIGVLSGFISAFSNINATNCNLTLEFPNYAGGTRVVNICSGKEKAPRIVEIGSSLLLIGIFVPLAYILIKMIYNEIRSWTNG